ncbi:MAG: porin [Pseudomonadota bacterium]
MKKLLSSVALLGVAASIASPAIAADDSAVKLDLSGYARGYVSYVSQDDDGGEVADFDMLRDTEIHFTGETTLDSGLTIGAHIETAVDNGDNAATGDAIDESYLYFSGNWGRVNMGEEDGAAYLLQVAAPSADSNFDGVRQYIQPLNDTAAGLVNSSFNIDYANDEARDADKVTYLSPVFNGFQLGASYTPETTDGAASDIGGNRLTDSDLDDGYEAAVRYEGTLSNVGFAVGGGYTHINNEAAGADDFKEWNVGLDMNIADFGVGAVYTENNGAADDADSDTWVVGADYTVGAYKIGASYLNNEDDGAASETDRYAAGVTYSYAPGLSFRGSISHTQVDEDGVADVDGTAVLLGTQVNF